MLLAAVFVVAVAGKLGSRRYAEFVTTLRQWTGWSGRLAALAAATSIAGETAVPVLLAGPGTAMAGLMLAAALLVAFTVAMLFAHHRGVTVPCRCFGASVAPLSGRHVLRNAFLATVTVVGVAIALSPVAVQAPHPAGLLVAGTAGLVAAALAVRLDDIAELFPAARTPVVRTGG